MAPSLKKALKAFIDEIPAAKLENFPGSAGTLYKDDNFRLDLQGVSVPFSIGAFLDYSLTRISAQVTQTAYNLQIQANKGAPNTSVRKAAPQSVSAVLKKFDSKISVGDVRQAFHRSAESGSTITI
jgi:hypothetical protein